MDQMVETLSEFYPHRTEFERGYLTNLAEDLFARFLTGCSYTEFWVAILVAFPADTDVAKTAGVRLWGALNAS